MAAKKKQQEYHVGDYIMWDDKDGYGVGEGSIVSVPKDKSFVYVNTIDGEDWKVIPVSWIDGCESSQKTSLEDELQYIQEDIDEMYDQILNDDFDESVLNRYTARVVERTRLEEKLKTSDK